MGGRRVLRVGGCAGPGAQTTWWFELTWQYGTNKCTHIKKNCLSTNWNWNDI